MCREFPAHVFMKLLINTYKEEEKATFQKKRE